MVHKHRTIFQSLGIRFDDNVQTLETLPKPFENYKIPEILIILLKLLSFFISPQSPDSFNVRKYFLATMTNAFAIGHISESDVKNNLLEEARKAEVSKSCVKKLTDTTELFKVFERC